MGRDPVSCFYRCGLLRQMPSHVLVRREIGPGMGCERDRVGNFPISDLLRRVPQGVMLEKHNDARNLVPFRRDAWDQATGIGAEI